MRDTVDYRLLELFRARRRLNVREPGEKHPAEAPPQQAVAGSRRVRALELRD